MTPSQANKKPRAAPVNDDWWGETAVCIGCGPSLVKQDIELIKGKARVIAINNAFMLAPFADILYACDSKWWGWWYHKMPDFEGEKWTQDINAARRYQLRWIEGRAGPGLSTDPRVIHNGHNSGYQAINLAYHKGACRIVLLGYDMKFGDDERAHFFGDHPDKVRSNYAPWLKAYKTIAEQDKIEIINATRDTALDCFPRIALEDIAWN